MENCNGTQLANMADRQAHAKSTATKVLAGKRVPPRSRTARQGVISIGRDKRAGVQSTERSTTHSSPFAVLAFLIGMTSVIPLPSGTIWISRPPEVGPALAQCLDNPAQRT